MLRKVRNVLLDGQLWLKQARQLVGIALVTGGYLVFLIPSLIVPGGVVGIAAVVARLTGGRLPVGGVTWSINVVLYVSTLHLLGYRHILRVLFTSTVLAVLMDLFTPLVHAWVIPALYGAGTTEANPNLLLYAVVGGALIGAGTAVIYRAGGATGGTDVAAYALHRALPQLPLSQAMLLVDGGIILAIVLIVGNWNLALYAMAVKFIASRVMDNLMSGGNLAKGIQIVTSRPDVIAGRILNELKRGVTATQCEGMYTHTSRMMLFCVIKTEQLQRLRGIIAQEDPDAFVVMSDLREVLGRGFTPPKV